MAARRPDDRAGLAPEHVALLDLVDELVEREVAPRAVEAERTGVFPRELFDRLGALDLAGLPFAPDVGGGGVPSTVALRVIERLSGAFLTVGMGLSVHTLATWVVDTYAAEPVRSEVLARLTSGTWLGAYALSEPGSGSDAAGLVARARRDGDEYVLEGTKAWITHAGVADVYVVLCRTAEHRTRGISAFLVPGDAAGLVFPAPERKMALSASPTGQMVLDGVRVPTSHLLGEEGQGFAIAMAALDGGRLGIAAGATGIAQVALDHAVAHARTRRQFGARIGDFQGMTFLLADMATAVAAARALYLQAAERRDRGEPFAAMASMAKLFASDAAMSVTTDAVQVFGGYGYTTEYPVERLMREAKVLQIVEGTNQIQRLVIGRGLLDPDRR